MRHPLILGMGFMLLSAFFFAVSGPVAKGLYEAGWTPGSVVLVRLAGATLALGAPTLLALRGRWAQVRAQWRLIAVYGVVSMAGVQSFYFLAIEHLSVAVAVLLEVMGAPLLVVLWLWVRTRVAPSAVTGLGALLCAVGVVLVLDLADASLSWLGIGLALAAAACFAFYFVISARQTMALPALPLTGLGMGAGAITVLIANASQAMPAHYVNADVSFAGTHMPWYAPTSLLIVFTVLAYVCGVLGLRHLGATVGSFANLVEVPVSAVAAWWLLGESLTIRQIAGTCVVLTGIALVKWGDLTRQPLTITGSAGDAQRPDSPALASGRALPQPQGDNQRTPASQQML